MAGFRFGDGAFHALAALGEHQLRAVGLEDIAALDAHGLGHGEDDAVALGGGDGRKADAGIAGGGLNDDGAGLQQALCLRILDHRLGDAVLDTAGGVQVFKLHQKPSLQAQLLLEIRDLHQRCVADETQCAFVNVCHDDSSN